MGSHVIFGLAHGSDQALTALPGLQRMVAGRLERQRVALGKGEDGLLFFRNKGRQDGGG